MTLYLGNNELSQKIMLNGVQMPLMNDETSGMMLSNNGSKPYWTYGQITNCLTKIPQDIKLELNSDNTITLKAGSKLYIPNGFETDDTTKKFDIKIIESDINFNASTYASNQYMACLLPTNLIQALITSTQQFSGDTAPTVTSTYAFWYDTANNIIKYTIDNGASWQNGCSLPFSLLNITNGTGIISIEQVFNGFSFIGNTIIKNGGNTYIFPNGNNDDGSQNNIVKILPTLTCWTISLAPNTSYTLFARVSEDERNMEFLETSKVYYQNNAPTLSTYSIWYSPNENKWKYVLNDISNGWLNDWVVCPIGTFLTDASGKITTFSFNNAYQLFDKNDTTFITQQVMPGSKYVSLTLGASGATYIAPANGYFSIDGQGPNWVDIAIIRSGLNYGYCYASRSADKYLRTIIPVLKGETCQILFDTEFTNLISFKFIYAKGEI